MRDREIFSPFFVWFFQKIGFKALSFSDGEEQLNQGENFKNLFLEEATDHLETFILGLGNINQTVADHEDSQRIFRAAFCLKGGSDLLGLDNLKKIVYGLEQCFQTVRDNHLSVNHLIQCQFTDLCQILVEIFAEIATTDYGQLTELNRAIAPNSAILLEQLKESIEICIPLSDSRGNS